MILPDLLDKNLNIVFCGMAASKKSAELKGYYAGPGNKFWKALYESKLTPNIIDPSDYTLLLNYKIGLTDISKEDYGNDNELNKHLFDPDRLKSSIITYQPKLLVFNGKMAAKIYFNKDRVDYGIQDNYISQTQIYICPSTSGAANAFWDMNIWKELINYI